MGLTGEVADHKVAGVVADQATAQELAAAVRAKAGLQENQVRVLSPGDDHIGRALEPDSRGIAFTMIRAHLWLALVGAVVGALAFGILFALGIEFITLSPWRSAALIIGFSIVGGLMLGGAVTLRPDHSPYITASREALQAGKYVVVVHATSNDQLQEAETVLKAGGSETIRTL